MVTRTLGEPGADSGVFVSGVIVDDRMHIEIDGNLSVDVTQETEELLMSMARFALGDDATLGPCTTTITCENLWPARRGLVADRDFRNSACNLQNYSAKARLITPHERQQPVAAEGSLDSGSHPRGALSYPGQDPSHARDDQRVTGCAGGCETLF